MTTDQTLLPDNCKNESPLIDDPLPDQPIPSMYEVSEKYILELGRWMYRNRSMVVVALDQCRVAAPAPLSPVDERDLTTAYMAGQMSNRPAPVTGVQEAYKTLRVFYRLEKEDNGLGKNKDLDAYKTLMSVQDVVMSALIAAGARE